MDPIRLLVSKCDVEGATFRFMDADFESLDLPDSDWEETDNTWSHWLAKQFDPSGFHGMFRRVTFCAFILVCCAGVCLYFSRPKERRALPLSAIGLHELVTHTPADHEIYRLRARVTQSQYDQYVERLGLNETQEGELRHADHWEWKGPDRPSWWHPKSDPKQTHTRVASNSETHARYIDGSVYVVRVRR